MQQSISFPSGTTNYRFLQSGENPLDAIPNLSNAILITDEHIAALYPNLFRGRKCIVLPATEDSKDITTIAHCTQQLLQLEATRKTMLVGVGGGMTTDITGFLATVYMRGVPFGFIPTSLLGMTDAAIGGKNGVNAGLNKNIIGTIRQPQFIIYDTAFLHTLPAAEWSNGFAEIIKYACIFDAPLFEDLSRHDLSYYQQADNTAISAIIQQCVAWKNKTVQEDEQEQGIRKLLNFGHTAAHAIENMYHLAHGQAVSIGMVIASRISERQLGLDKAATRSLKQLLTQYKLPIHYNINAPQAMKILIMDKKRSKDTIDYILLERIGKATIKPLPFSLIEDALTNL